jgi:CRP-like cAMP-binding protein
VLFRQGDPGTSLYVVTSGEVRIGLEALPEEDIIPALVGPGETLGELALLDGLPRSATATMSMDTELLMLSREDFLTLIDSGPKVVRAVLKALAAMIRRSDERLAEVLMSVHTRMARRLLELAELHGVPHPFGILIDREVTDTELAGLTGLHRIHVERLMADYQYEDIIRMEAGRIIIHRRDKLEAWAGRR